MSLSTTQPAGTTHTQVRGGVAGQATARGVNTADAQTQSASEYTDNAVPGQSAPGRPTPAYGAPVIKAPLKPMTIKRREPGANDVQIDVLFCGVCHSDIHQAENDWKNTVYPCVPGHEIVGRVSAVGSGVTTTKVGDVVGVGCMVDSCRQCPNCQAGLEQYCEGPKGFTATYNGPAQPDGTNTYGGYSSRVVVDQHFVLKVPGNLDLASVPPLLCAGVTTYSPLRHWNVKAGQSVVVVGMGGLGHMAVKLATAMGANVTVVSSSPDKEQDARQFGAKNFVLEKDAAALKKLKLTHDFVLVTIPEPFDVNTFVPLLKRDGALVTVGLLAPYAGPLDNSEVAFHRRTVSGSLIGGIPETQEVLDFCGQHNIGSTVQTIRIDEINDAFLKVKSGKVRYRYVIDVANSFQAA